MTVLFQPDQTRFPIIEVDWKQVMFGYMGPEGANAIIAASTSAHKHGVKQNEIIRLIADTYENLGKLFPEKAEVVFRIAGEERKIYEIVEGEAEIKDKERISEEVDRRRTPALVADLEVLESIDLRICHQFHCAQQELISVSKEVSPRSFFAKMFSGYAVISPEKSRALLGSMVGMASRAFNGELDRYGAEMPRLVPVNYSEKIEAARARKESPASKYYH